MSRYQLKAYQDVERKTSSMRQTEARVLTSGANKLKYCQDHWEDKEREKLLDEALKYNQMIWSVFQTDLVKPTGRLPESLRMKLLQLSLYIDKQIFTTMASPSPDKLTPIININLGLAKGLISKKRAEASIRKNGTI